MFTLSAASLNDNLSDTELYSNIYIDYSMG